MTTLKQAFGTLLERIARTRRIARDRAHLMRFDDRQLDDIGITRGQIDDFINGRMPRDVSYRPSRTGRLSPRLDPVCCPAE